MRTRHIMRLGLIYAMAIVGLAFTLGPIFYIVTISIRPSPDMYVTPFAYIPPHPTLDNYVNVLLNRTASAQAHLPEAFGRTIVVALSATISAVVLATLAGYGLARFRFRGRETFGVAMLSTQMMPPVLFLVPLFLIFRQLNLTNTLAGLTLSYLTFALPFCTWMLRSYFEDIPVELEDAAMIDGCTRLRVLRHVVLPVAVPALVATAIFAFILGGNIPLLTVSLYAFISQYGPEYGNLMAAAVMVALPPVVLFVLLQRHLIGGLTAGAVKH